ncbi:MAG: hypothetical protein U0936_23255 [Planctomycetaceae bacterium]
MFRVPINSGCLAMKAATSCAAAGLPIESATSIVEEIGTAHEPIHCLQLDMVRINMQRLNPDFPTHCCFLSSIADALRLQTR